MSSAKAGPTDGFVHGVGFYGSDEEFGRTFAPFCEAGLASGVPTVVRLEALQVGLLRSTLGSSDGLVFLPHEDQYPHPPGALASVLELLDRHTAKGTEPLRLLGELRHWPVCHATRGCATSRR